MVSLKFSYSLYSTVARHSGELRGRVCNDKLHGGLGTGSLKHYDVTLHNVFFCASEVIKNDNYMYFNSGTSVYNQTTIQLAPITEFFTFIKKIFKRNI